MKFGLARGALLQTHHGALGTVTSGGGEAGAGFRAPGLLRDVRGTPLGSAAPHALLLPEPAACALRGRARSISHIALARLLPTDRGGGA